MISVHTWVSANGIAERGAAPGCGVVGEAVVTRTYEPGYPERDQLEWTRADPQTHIDVELLCNLGIIERQFLAERYELGEPCPHYPGARHAQLRSQPVTERWREELV